MRLRSVLALLALLSASPLPSQAGPVPDQAALRDQTSRLAIAVLGEICLLNIGDANGIAAAAAPGGEFGFVEAPADLTAPLLGDRGGYVRVLRRPGMGAVTLVASKDGDCSVMAEYADAAAIRTHLLSMVERGGLRNGGSLVVLDTRDDNGVRLTNYALNPQGWFAALLAKRFGGEGAAPLPLVTAIAPPGRAASEAILSVRRPPTAH